jgi:hypothetical protein
MVVAAPNPQGVRWHQWIDTDGALASGDRTALQRDFGGDTFSQPGQTAVPNDAEVPKASRRIESKRDHRTIIPTRPDGGGCGHWVVPIPDTGSGLREYLLLGGAIGDQARVPIQMILAQIQNRRGMWG